MNPTELNLNDREQSHSPVDDVGEEVVVLEPVVHAHLLVVDGQRAGVDTPLLQSWSNVN